MKKLLALSLGLLFLGVGVASATDVEVSGSYYAEGTYYDNVQNPPQQNVSGFSDYEHELDVHVTFNIDDTTRVITQIEAMDNDWARSANTAAPNDEGTAGAALAELDDNIVIEKVYGVHEFSNGGKLQVGLMDGGATVWAYDFGQGADENYRILYTHPTSLGLVIAIIEKLNEEGDTAGNENGDWDAYYLGLVSEWNGVTIQPIVAYAHIDDQVPTNEEESFFAFLALGSSINNVNWEFEVDYRRNTFENEAANAPLTAAAVHKNHDTYGVWGHVYTTVNALTVGVHAAYGSWDEDANAGFDTQDDFDAGGALIMGDDIHFANGTGYGAVDLVAPTLIAVYADYQMNAKTVLGAYFGYAVCNIDEPANSALKRWEDASIWEVSGDITYSITPNLTYKIAAGVAQLEYDDNNFQDPDSSTEINHRLTFTF